MYNEQQTSLLRTILDGLAITLICIAVAATAYRYFGTESGSITERDDCISNLRGLAEMDAAKQGLTVLRIDQGEYVIAEGGGVKCSARFLTAKDGKESFSQVFSAQVANQSK